MDCVFCKIANGEIPSYKVYEDGDLLVFLDIKPASKGHCLVIPKKHAENIFDISEENLQKISVVAKKISQKITEKLAADGVRISQSNGRVAGQEVMHYHLHIIPRYEGDEIISPTATLHLPQADFKELEKIADLLKN